MVGTYPVQFNVDFPARPLDRVSTVFRIFAAIPILIVLGLLPSQALHGNNETAMDTVTIGSGLVFLPLVLMILFRQKYPRWWFDWNLNLQRFSNRVLVYLALLDDHYPSTDEEQAVHLDFPYPDAHQLNRWLPLVKWFLAIPHYFVLVFLFIGALVAEWSERLPLPEDTIRTYLTANIHYVLDEECVEGMRCFFRKAAEIGILPAYDFSLSAMAV